MKMATPRGERAVKRKRFCSFSAMPKHRTPSSSTSRDTTPVSAEESHSSQERLSYSPVPISPFSSPELFSDSSSVSARQSETSVVINTALLTRSFSCSQEALEAENKLVKKQVARKQNLFALKILVVMIS